MQQSPTYLRWQVGLSHPWGCSVHFPRPFLLPRLGGYWFHSHSAACPSWWGCCSSLGCPSLRHHWALVPWGWCCGKAGGTLVLRLCLWGLRCSPPEDQNQQRGEYLVLCSFTLPDSELLLVLDRLLEEGHLPGLQMPVHLSEQGEKCLQCSRKATETCTYVHTYIHTHVCMHACMWQSQYESQHKKHCDIVVTVSVQDQESLGSIHPISHALGDIGGCEPNQFRAQS